jgi:hypothetical protein
MTMQGSVTVTMQASAQEVWDVVSDVTRIGELSPETFEAEWLGDATGPAVGAHFRGHVKRNGRGPTYWTECKVTVADEPRSFGFDVIAGGRTVNSWRYDIAPRKGTTGEVDVTESFHFSESPLTAPYRLLFGKARSRTNERGMRQTLERVKAIVESA